jgi:predicted transcriptional regulator
MSTSPADRLGELEHAVLEILWASEGAVPVRAVQAALEKTRPLAYTTILTVLDRLHEKGVVAREKDGRAFLYRPRLAREAWMAERAVSALAPRGRPPEGVWMAFLDSVASRDPAMLDRLATLIAERRGRR